MNKKELKSSLIRLNPTLDVKLGSRWGKGYLIRYRVTSAFNGVTNYKGKLVSKIEMPDLVIPKGYRVVNLGVLLEMNVIPHEATELVLEDKCLTT